MQFTSLTTDKAKKAIEELEKSYPNSKDLLNFNTPVDMLVAIILAARTRDETTNSVTQELFKRYKTAKDYANANEGDILKYARKVQFAGNKVKNIIAACKIVAEKYKGKVPKSIEGLVELPGIGRKSANTLLINAYGIASGIPVDTWVKRLSFRIGLSKSEDPDEIEKDLMEVVDKKYWTTIAFAFKRHGRAICQPLVPLCSRCVLTKLCPRNGVAKSL